MKSIWQKVLPMKFLHTADWRWDMKAARRLQFLIITCHPERHLRAECLPIFRI